MGCGNSKNSDPSTDLVTHQVNDNTRFPQQNGFVSSKYDSIVTGDAETQNNNKENIEEPLETTLDSVLEVDVSSQASQHYWTEASFTRTLIFLTLRVNST